MRERELCVFLMSGAAIGGKYSILVYTSYISCIESRGLVNGEEELVIRTRKEVVADQIKLWQVPLHHRSSS